MYISVKPSELATIMINVVRSKDSDADTEVTITELMQHVDKSRGRLSNGMMERCLYLMNMNNEQGIYQSFNGESFQDFCRRVIPREYEFNTTYNLLRRKPDNG